MAKFIDPHKVVGYMGLKSGQVVADLGAGSGFYAVAAGKIVGNTGIVYAIDVQEAKLIATHSAAAQNGLNNIQVFKADLDKPFLDIAETSCDAVIIASILHEVSSREALLKNAYRLLKSGGRLLIVEWKLDPAPFGPSMQQRIDPEKLTQELAQLGLRKDMDVPADSYHYAMVFVK